MQIRTLSNDIAHKTGKPNCQSRGRESGTGETASENPNKMQRSTRSAVYAQHKSNSSNNWSNFVLEKKYANKKFVVEEKSFIFVRINLHINKHKRD